MELDIDMLVLGRELAAVLKVDQSYITKLTKQGIFAKDGQKYRLSENIYRYMEYLRSQNRKGNEEQEAKARKELAQAEMAEMKLAQMKDDLVEVSEVVKVVEEEYALVRTAMIRLPSKSASALSVMDDPADIQQELQTQVDEILSNLSVPTELVSSKVLKGE